ncbi:MAG: methyltransferase, partial [Candidatus Saccharibacteria bacterium]|nr:methyltransferase [Candidatus Saccharibacteria bacterium]
DEFKKLQLPDFALVADIGCGSGVLGITASLEKAEIRLNMIDIDEKVFNIAKSNARTFEIKAEYYTGDLLEAYPDKYDVLLCNLPYVPVNYPVNKASEHEPRIALFSGSDGLEHFRRLFKQLQTGDYGTPVVITESLVEQHKQLKEIAQEAGFKQTAEKDLVQVFKMKI